MEAPQVSFTSGEIAPALYGRIDYNRYYNGLKTCRNFIVRPMGGVANRPGFQAFSDAQASAVRLVPFQATSTLSYILEFSTGLIRIFRYGVEGPVDTVVTPYQAADIMNLKYTQNNDVLTIVHVSYPVKQLGRYADTDWRLENFVNSDGPFLDINVDDTVTVTASASTGSITLNASSALFTASTVGRLIYIEQNPDASTKKWEVQKAITINDVRRAGSNYYKAVASGTTGTVRPTTLDGVEYDGDPGVPWQYQHSGSGIARIETASGSSATATVLRFIPTSVVSASSTKTITNVVLTTISMVDHLDVSAAAHGFASGDTLTISGVLGITEANGTFQVVVLNANTFRLENQTTTGTYTSGGSVSKTLTAMPTYKWAFESWKGEQGYPSTSTYHQQRQIFAGTALEAGTMWLSQTAGYKSFLQNQPLLDDDAISFTVSSRERNEIRHLVELSELIMLTSTGEWVIRGNQDGALTPSSLQVKRQGYCGSSQLMPMVIDSYALFLQDKGSQIRSLGYSFQEDAFIGKDMTIISSHMFQGHTIVDWAYQKVPFSAVWAVREDGVLLCMTYMPEHEIVGWSWHDTPGGLFKSVCCVSENGNDTLYALVERSGTRYIERMPVRYPASSTAADWMDRGTIPYIQEIETLEVNAPSQNLRDKNKLISHVTLLCEESVNLLVGPDSTRLTPTQGAARQGTTGTIDIRIQTSWNKGGRVVVRNNANTACTILAVMPEITTGGA